MGVKLAQNNQERIFTRWQQQVSGWFASPHELEEKAGVFIIATQSSSEPLLLEVGESDNVRFRVLNHDNRIFWRRNALAGILYAAIYTDESDSAFLSEFSRQNLVHHICKLEQPALKSAL